MPDDTKTILILAFCELIAVIVIVRLWSGKQQMHPVARILWSVVILVPVFGVWCFDLRIHPTLSKKAF